MQTPSIRELLNRHLAGQLTENERQELDSILQNTDYEGIVKEELARLMQAEQPSSVDEGEWGPVLEQVFAADKTKDDAVVRPMKRWVWWSAAAVALLVMVGGWEYYHRQRPEPVRVVKVAPILPGSNKAILTLASGQQIALDDAPNGVLSRQGGVQVVKKDSGRLEYRGSAAVDVAVLYNTIATPRGGQYQMVLPDGTKVWLNAASSLRFPTAFTGKERTVWLTGEAYFEAARDKDKPFLVKAGNMETRVLGTQFDVMAYPDEETINSTLLEGAVMVGEGEKQALLQPGEQGQLDAERHLLVKKRVNTRVVTAWKDGYYFFDRTPVAGVLRQIGRWYDVDIVYARAVPKDEIVGKIPRTANVADVLHLMELIGIRFRIEGRRILVLDN